MPRFDLGGLVHLGLQIAGMSPDDARSLTDTVDWTTTLVIPIGQGGQVHEQVDVDGVRGILLTHPTRKERPPAYSLIWVKHGIAYGMMGYGNGLLAIPVANSLS
jgi:hypothetical protein